MLSKRKSLFRTLLSMSKPESLIIFIDCLSCAVIGAAQTLFAILLAKIIAVSNWSTRYSWPFLHSTGIQPLCIFWQQSSSIVLQLSLLATGSFLTDSSFYSGKSLSIFDDLISCFYSIQCSLCQDRNWLNVFVWKHSHVYFVKKWPFSIYRRIARVLSVFVCVQMSQLLNRWLESD